MSCMNAIGMKTYLKSLKNASLTIFHISGHFRPIAAMICINKNRKNHKKFQKTRFFKNRYFFMWWPEICFLPEINPLDPGKYPETSYWLPYVIWLDLKKSRKNRIFDPRNHGKKFSKVDFFGGWASITKSILGIDRPYRCPESPIILVYAPYPFLPVCIM